MTDYTDLKARASGRAQFCRDRGEIKTPELLEDALAAITALEADIARLQTAHVQMQRAMDDLAAENARLKAKPSKPIKSAYHTGFADGLRKGMAAAALTAPTSGC